VMLSCKYFLSLSIIICCLSLLNVNLYFLRRKLTDSSIKLIAEHCHELCALDLMNLSKLSDSSMVYLTNGCRALNVLKLCRNTFRCLIFLFSGTSFVFHYHVFVFLFFFKESYFCTWLLLDTSCMSPPLTFYNVHYIYAFLFLHNQSALCNR